MWGELKCSLDMFVHDLNEFGCQDFHIKIAFWYQNSGRINPILRISSLSPYCTHMNRLPKLVWEFDASHCGIPLCSNRQRLFLTLSMIPVGLQRDWFRVGYATKDTGGALMQASKILARVLPHHHQHLPSLALPTLGMLVRKLGLQLHNCN